MSACPSCGTEVVAISVGPDRTHARAMSVRISARLFPWDPIDCGHCGFELYSGDGSKVPNVK